MRQFVAQRVIGDIAENEHRVAGYPYAQRDDAALVCRAGALKRGRMSSPRVVYPDIDREGDLYVEQSLGVR